MTVVAVGAGCTGTEVVAQTERGLTRIVAPDAPRPGEVRWLLVDLAPTVLPELDPRLGADALSVLEARGVDVRLATSVSSADDRSITLTNGSVIPSRTLTCSAGVVASPLVATVGLPLQAGRLSTDAQLRADEHSRAVGDAAAVPDLASPANPGRARALTAPTAQHAQRQARSSAARSRPAWATAAAAPTSTQTSGSSPTSAAPTPWRGRSGSS